MRIIAFLSNLLFSLALAAVVIPKSIDRRYVIFLAIFFMISIKTLEFTFWVWIPQGLNRLFKDHVFHTDGGLTRVSLRLFYILFFDASVREKDGTFGIAIKIYDDDLYLLFTYVNLSTGVFHTRILNTIGDSWITDTAVTAALSASISIYALGGSTSDVIIPILYFFQFFFFRKLACYVVNAAIDFSIRNVIPQPRNDEYIKFWRSLGPVDIVKVEHPERTSVRVIYAARTNIRLYEAKSNF